MSNMWQIPKIKSINRKQLCGSPNAEIFRKHDKATSIRRSGKNTQKDYTKKDLNDPDNHDGVITYSEPDILECEVKWALGSIMNNKASRGDGTPADLFQILKDDAVKVLHSICQQIWKTQKWPQDWKRSVSLQSPKRSIPKNVPTTTQLYSFHTLAKSCSKFSKPGFNSMWTENFQIFKLDLEKAEEPEIKLPTSVRS